MNRTRTGRYGRQFEALAQRVSFTDDEIVVGLADGRTISVPLAWYSRLAEATPEERLNFELLGGGLGIHWPALDEDLSIAGMLRLE